LSEEGKASKAKGNSPKLLLVDDDKGIQNTLKIVLEMEGFEVFATNDGITALELVGVEDFKVVISDIKMPGIDGLELLKHIRKVNSKLPVILMTGFSKIAETKQAFELGARAFLAKPFKREELVSVLRSACDLSGAKELLEEADSSEDYCRIDIDQFISGKTLNFEIFMQLSKTKYIKVAQKGEDITLSRVRAFRNKGVVSLYIRKHDFGTYVGFNLSQIPVKKRKLSREEKLQVIRNANSVIFEKLYLEGIGRECFQHAKEITETTIALLIESSDGFDLLNTLHASRDHFFTHSLGVSLYSTLIAKQIGWTSPVTLFKISTAGLFHDIGMMNINQAIDDKHRSTLSKGELSELESHPARAEEILRGIPALSTEILQAVLQHHESCNGHGYPAKLRRAKINPMARLISVADEFCEMAIAGKNFSGFSPREAMARLTSLHSDALDPQFMNALKTVMGHDQVVSPLRKGG
jgi:two-component system, response regulator, stage 0 sporulation protein F